MGFLEDWDLNYDEINALLTENPSLRSFVMGYAAEVRCRNMHFVGDPRITNVTKYDDHDREKKGDIAFDYCDYTFTVEVKSVQTVSMTPQKRSGLVKPYFQCDASDSRTVTLPNGEKFKTTSLVKGQFDILAVNLHAFYGAWEFVFADNKDLPTVRGVRGAEEKYTDYQMDWLLRSTMPMSNPPEAPYTMDPFAVLDVLVDRRRAAGVETNSELLAEGKTAGVDALGSVLEQETKLKLEEDEDPKKAKDTGDDVLFSAADLESAVESGEIDVVVRDPQYLPLRQAPSPLEVFGRRS